jgi:hypothetical protein
MLTRVIATSPSSACDKVGHTSQSNLIQCEMQRFVAFTGPARTSHLAVASLVSHWDAQPRPS